MGSKSQRKKHRYRTQAPMIQWPRSMRTKPAKKRMSDMRKDIGYSLLSFEK